MTIAHGSGVRASTSPSRSGFRSRTGAWAMAASLLRLDGVPAELVPQGGQHLGGKRVLLPRTEPDEQAGRDGRRRDCVVDRLLQRPATLARILHPALDGAQLGVALERGLRQLEQPGSYNTAMVPELGQLRHREGILGSLQD